LPPQSKTLPGRRPFRTQREIEAILREISEGRSEALPTALCLGQ